MQRVEKAIVVDCPIRDVYDQWTRFEEFPRFMAGVKEVRQLDDTHLRWHAQTWGREDRWVTEITEQSRDRRISWRSLRGMRSAGVVHFESIGPRRTRIRLVLAREPDGDVENLSGVAGAMDSQLQASVERFKSFMERRDTARGGPRGANRRPTAT